MSRRSLLLLLTVACATEPAPDAPPATGDGADGTAPLPSDPDPLPADPPDDPDVSSSPVEEADLRPEAEQAHRARKRMTIDQARAVMEQVSGGVAWTDDDDDNLWEAYGDTLGVPDYQTRLRDNLDPSIMFQKFLDDAAVQTCDGWVVAEATGARADRSFFIASEPDETTPAAVADNVVALRRTLHGQVNAPDDPVVDSYGLLFEAALRRSGDPVSAWTTVCVGLFTHPDFFLY